MLKKYDIESRANKAARSLNDTIWKNKHLRQDKKTRIIKQLNL